MRTALFQFRTCCFLGLLYAFTAAFAPAPADRYEIRFTRIDNQVVVSQLGQQKEVVFDSGVIHHAPNLDIRVNITPFVQPNSRHFLVEGFNAPWAYGNPWELRYDLLCNGQVIESVHEYNHDPHCPEGKVFEREHVLTREAAQLGKR